MKKNSSVQGTFSRLFGKKHGNSGNSSTTSLYVTNPPWVFTQEVSSDKLKSSGDIDDIYYGDNRFGSVTDSGTATLKARPRVRPLLTFLPLNAQEAHGVAVPTPSVPEGFEEKGAQGLGSQINGSYRKYNSVLDLRSKAFDENYFNNEDIPPPPSVPPPPPPTSIDISSPPPPLVEAPPPPPSEEVPPPPPMVPPPPPPVKPVASPSFLTPTSYPYSNVSSPSTPSPPDFIPPPPPLAFMDDPSPPVPPPPPPLPFHTPPFSNGVSKWKSETVLNLRQSETSPHNLNLTSPPTHNQKESQLPQSSPDPHLTFPRSLKVPPPTPVRTSSIPTGEKESSPQDEQFPKMVPHSRPALPPSFTIQTATMVHSKGEAGEKAALEKSSVLITDNSKLTSDSNDSSTVSLKCEVPVAEDAKFPTSDSASSDDDDDWKERTNLDKLKHELSALLSSSCRKDNRQPEQTVVPKTKTSITEGYQGSTDELKPVKPAATGPQLPTGSESERKEMRGTNAPSPGKASTGDALSAADNKSTTTPTNPVMKFKNELEAVLSPTKDGGPPLALANLRHNPETKKQVTLQFGGSQSRLTRLPANQNPTTSEVTKKAPESPNASSGKLLSGNIGKPPASPLKQKNETLAPAASSPISSGTASPVRTASPNIDFSLLQYKTHRTRFGSVDSLGSETSSQTTEEGPVSTNNGESRRDSAMSMSSQTSALSSNTEQANNNHVLVHPITGEKVERGSPMALLLAAQQRAQKGRNSATTSRQNSYLSEKPPLKLSEKLQNSTPSEPGSSSSSSSTIYYSDSKPNTVTVVPKSPQRASPSVLESKQPNGPATTESKICGTSGLGQREQRPPSFSSASEQCRNVQQRRESDSQNPPTPNRPGASTFEHALPEPSRLKPQGPHSTAAGSLSMLTQRQSQTQNNNDEVDVGFNYEIIPPPPEFSNDASGVTDSFSNGQDNPKGLNVRGGDWASDKRPTYNHSSYIYGNSYSLASKLALENSPKPSGYSHHYPGGTCSGGYLSSYSRPLIKKRLYVSDSDGSYGRSAMTSRSMSTPTTYGHNTMAYSSQVAEGMRRMNPGHRNVPNSAQGRRVSLELPGKMVTYNNTAGDNKYKGQNGEYPTNAAAAGRPSHGSQQSGGTANTFTVRPGTRQPISYSYQGGLR